MTVFFLVLLSVLLFCLIIFIHELGHFLVAKLCGVRVNEFSLGMGPKLFSFTKGETSYELRLFPIGGFCAMEGEDEDSSDPRAFNRAKVWKRILIVSAGAVMNLLLGLVLMFCILVQDKYYTTVKIADFAENSATQAAGLQVGDEFYSIDGYRIYSGQDLSYGLGLADLSDGVDIQVKRDGEILSFDNVALGSLDVNGTAIVQIDFYVYARPQTVGTLLQNTVLQSVSVVRMVWASLVGIVTGRFGLNDLAGPVGIAQTITQVASEGLKQSFLDAFNSIMMVMAVITINLGLVNMLPLPALDGGRLVFLLLEAIRRKPVPAKYEGWVHTAGFVFLMILMVVITFNDIVRLVTGGSFG